MAASFFGAGHRLHHRLPDSDHRVELFSNDRNNHFIAQHPANGTTLANYVYINTRTHFWTFLFNSLVVAFAACSLAIVLASLAGFAMSRFRARILGPYNQSLLVVQMFPLILAIIPLFILFRNLGMINNFVPVILVYTVTQLPFATWTFRSYFDSIPKDLDEAARVDGCSRLRGFVQIILPFGASGRRRRGDLLVPLFLQRIFYLQCFSTG
jgi:ABC-type glycerol-3-phosphate transport system permease component